MPGCQDAIVDAPLILVDEEAREARARGDEQAFATVGEPPGAGLITGGLGTLAQLFVYVRVDTSSTLVFTSTASDLVAHDGNQQPDVFVVELPGAESGFRVTTVTRLSTGVVTPAWPATEGRTYVVAAADAIDGSWTVVPVTIGIAGGQAPATDDAAAGLARRFYRVRVSQ